MFNFLYYSVFAISAFLLIWTYVIYLLLIRSLRIFHKPIKKNTYYPSFSIIIPTYNEESVIKEKIKNTRSISYPKNKIEIIVVDSNSTDRTVEIAKNFKDIKVIEEKQRSGKSHAINTALKQASGEIVLLTDADSFLLHEDALIHVAENFADKSIGVVAAIPRFQASNPSIINKGISRSTAWRWTYESLLDSITSGMGEFLAFRKSLVERLDLECLADDVDICMHVRMQGYRIVYEPKVKVVEPAPDEFRFWYQQIVRRKVTGLTTLLHHKSVFLNPKYGWYGMLILPRAMLESLSPFFVFAFLVSSLAINPLFFFVFVMLAFSLLIFFPFRKFLVLQLVLLHSWVIYASGKYEPSWKKEPVGSIVLEKQFPGRFFQ